MAEPERELGEEVVDREKSLNSMPFLAGPIDEQDCGGPLRGELGLEPFELIGLLTSVHPYRHEALVNETDDSRVGVHLGLQPSTSASRRRRAEIEKDVPLLRSSLFERLLEVASPNNFSMFDGHGISPLHEP